MPYSMNPDMFSAMSELPGARSELPEARIDVKAEQGKVKLFPAAELSKTSQPTRAEWVATAQKIATLVGENVLAFASLVVGIPFFLITVAPFVGIGALVNAINTKINEAEDRRNNVMYDEFALNPALRGPAMMNAFKVSFCMLHYAASTLLKDYQLYKAHQEKAQQEQLHTQNNNIQKNSLEKTSAAPKAFTLTNNFADKFCEYANHIEKGMASKKDRLERGDEEEVNNRDAYLALLKAFSKDLPETMTIINKSLNQVPGLNLASLQRIDREFSEATANLIKYANVGTNQEEASNFQQYFRLSNETMLSLYQLGEELDKKGQPEEAGKVFNLLLHLNPDNRFYWTSYALSAFHAGNLEGAINILENCNAYTEDAYYDELAQLAEGLQQQANQKIANEKTLPKAE